MPKFRDAETGEYMSEEDALTRDPATWVEEEDNPTVSKAILKEIYRRCKANAITPTGSHVLNNTASVPLSQLQRILNTYGANIK